MVNEFKKAIIPTKHLHMGATENKFGFFYCLKNILCKTTNLFFLNMKEFTINIENNLFLVEKNRF